MSVTVKAKLMLENGAIENRIFSIDKEKDGVHNFLRSKISDLFSMKTEDFEVFWKDSDGDMITVSSDEEIYDAMKHVENSFLRIFIAENGKPQSKKDDKNKLLTCGECKNPIYRKMFKCLVCPEFAICKRCEIAGCHSDHRMIKLSAPVSPWRYRSIEDLDSIDRPLKNQFESFRQYRASRERRSGYRQELSRSYKASRDEPDGFRCHRRKIYRCEGKYLSESWNQVKSQVREAPGDDDKGNPVFGKGRAYGYTRRRRDPFRQIPEVRRLPFEDVLNMHQDCAVHPFRRNKRTSHGHKTPIPNGHGKKRIWTLPKVRKFIERDCHHEGVCKNSETNRNNKYETRKSDGICGNKHRNFKDSLLLYPCWAVDDKSRKIGVLKNIGQRIKENGESHSITQNNSDEEETYVLDGKTCRVGQRKMMRKMRSPKSRCKTYVERRTSMDIGYVRKCPTLRRRMCNRHMYANDDRKCHEKPCRKRMNRCHSCPPTGRYISKHMGHGRVARKHRRVQPSVVPHRRSRLHPRKREAYISSYMKRMSRYCMPKQCAIRFHGRRLEVVHDNVNESLLYRNYINRTCQRRWIGRTSCKRGGKHRNKDIKLYRTRKAMQGFCTRQRIRKCHRMHTTLANRQKRVLKGNNKRRLVCLTYRRGALRRPTCAMTVPSCRQGQYSIVVCNRRKIRRFFNKTTRRFCRRQIILGHKRYIYGNIKGTHRYSGRRNGSKCSLKSHKRCNFGRRHDRTMTKKYNTSSEGLKAKRCRGRFEIGNVNRHEFQGEMDGRGFDKQIGIVPEKRTLVTMVT